MKTNVTPKQEKLTLSNQNYSLRKYKLLELIDSQPLYIAKSLLKTLPSVLCISRQTFASYLNAPLGSSLQIPSDLLIMLSQLFSVRPSELLNYQLPLMSLGFFVPSSYSSTAVQTDLVS